MNSFSVLGIPSDALPSDPMNPLHFALPSATLLCLGVFLACTPKGPALGSAKPAPKTKPSVADTPLMRQSAAATPPQQKPAESQVSAEAPACASAVTLVEICQEMSQSAGAEDCALAMHQPFAGVTVHELVSGLNPPLHLRKAYPRGLSGKSWFTETADSPPMLGRKWVLEIGDRYYPLRDGYDVPDSKTELSFSQPPGFQEARLLLVEEKVHTGSSEDWMKTDNLTVIELSSVPRFAFHGAISTVSHSRDGSTYEERRNIVSLGSAAIELSERMGGTPGSMMEQEPPARVAYCSGKECPQICGEFPAERVGSWTEEEPFKMEVDGLHLTLVGRKGGRLECNNDRTMQAHLIGCAATGSKRSVDFAFDAGGDLRCGSNIPEYEFIHGGYFVNEDAKLFHGSTTVAFRLVNEPGFELTIILDPSAMKMEVQTSGGAELIEFGDQLSTDELYLRTPVEAGQAGLGYPFVEIDLTKTGKGCEP